MRDDSRSIRSLKTSCIFVTLSLVEFSPLGIEAFLDLSYEVIGVLHEPQSVMSTVCGVGCV